ncbi:MAG: hypothetical protein ACI4PW_10050 [Alphaproteobacteria bacterium]|jgi:hypothetical protein
MTEPKQFEDLFVHDGDIPPEEEEEDLGRDDEFVGRPRPSYRKKRDIAPPKPAGGCLKPLFFLFIIAVCLIYVFRPDLWNNMTVRLRAALNMPAAAPEPGNVRYTLETPPKTVQIVLPPSPPVREEEDNGYDPLLPAEMYYDFPETDPVALPNRQDVPLPPSPPPSARKQAAPRPLPPPRPEESPLPPPLPRLNGEGEVPDLLSAVRRNETLKKKVQELNDMPAARMAGFRSAVEEIVFLWTRTNSLPDGPGLSARKTAVLARTGRLPASEEEALKAWNNYIGGISFDLFAQIFAEQSGVPVSYDKNNGHAVILEGPIKTMALLFPKVNAAVESQASEAGKLQAIEPASSFFLRLCRGDIECLASYDVLIEALGLKEYLTLLQTEPEKVYDFQEIQP